MLSIAVALPARFCVPARVVEVASAYSGLLLDALPPKLILASSPSPMNS